MAINNKKSAIYIWYFTPVSKDCKAENFKIVRFAKLKSYNEAVLKYSDKIMEYFLKDIKCPQEKDIIHYYPIRFYLK